VAGLALAFALAAAMAPFAGGRVAAQDNGLASITIYTAVCPPGYTGDDFFGDCYDNTTDATGFTAFEGIDEDGLYTLQIQVPGDFADFVARCSDGGENFPFEYGDLFGEIDLDLTTSNDLRCDFYVIPIDQSGEQASITLYKSTCPAGYDDDNFFDDCFDNATSGVTFTVTNDDTDESIDATTGSDGFLAFEGLDAGTYILEEDIPANLDTFVVFCSAGGEDFPFTYSNTAPAIILELTTADDLRCDWYNIPDGPAPTQAPTQAPATSTVGTLPNTGVGPDGGSGNSFLPLGAAAILVVIGGAGLFATRARLSRVQVRTNR
jgi:hypothetical protein